MTPGSDAITDDRRLERLTWAFIGLGMLLRAGRYLMDYPLWWDEAFLAVNFIRRGYLDLLRPLDYNQVCPILFLWIELTVVKLAGFSEWSLRLFPLVCSVASVVAFRHMAGRAVCGVPLLLAVAIFAVSFHPIRHAADVKPYASDLLVALLLLMLVFEALRAPDQTGWLWTLAALTPFALALSHPAIFIVGGIAVGLFPLVVCTRRRKTRLAYACFGATTATSFLALYVVFTRAQAASTLGTMQAQWTAAFPPLGDPLELMRWLATVHTGGMFAYPCGGEHGASSLTLLLFLAGAAVLWRQRHRTLLLICLAPFGLALVAAALRRYPYGGVAHGSPARVMQYLVPSISLLTGLGAARMQERIRSLRWRGRILSVGLVALAVVGIVPLLLDIRHPYRSVHAQRARQFARRFWPALATGAVPVCLRWDPGLVPWDSRNLNVAVYLCNQQIHSPARQHRGPIRSSAVSPALPLRCVLPMADPSDPRVAAWLDSMKTRYRMTASRRLLENMAEPGAPPRIEEYDVYEFEPLPALSRNAK
jgi:4-amino-4-deoxy-L-arabinose transferase-like glycosyltransferase